MAVGKRKHGQERNRYLARSTKTAPNRDPVMVFVMSLLLSAAVTNDRILRANWAPANDYRRASFRPIGIQLALRRGNWDKDNRANGLCLGCSNRPKILPRAEPSPLSKISPEKAYRILRHTSYLHHQSAKYWPVKSGDPDGLAHPLVVGSQRGFLCADCFKVLPTGKSQYFREPFTFRAVRRWLFGGIGF
jgi:hypothetical protein